MPLRELTMQQYLIALTLMIAGGILAFLTRKSRNLSAFWGAGSAILGALVAAWPVAHVLLGRTDMPVLMLQLPLGEATLRLDAISAFFALPILFLQIAVSLFSGIDARHDKHAYDGWLFFNMLSASMLLLLVSANAVLFLVAWELMSVAAFFTIAYRDEIASARSAGWKYLVASHIGTAALMLLFAMLAAQSGGFEFSQFAAARLPSGMHSVAFLLALFGFGVKFGLLPLHVWLPDAHAFADAPVSAVLSGAMIKMGFYGLLRIMMLLPAPEAFWGWILVVGGLLTGIYAMAMALAQSDLKKVIAYSSIENAGIIMMGIGCSLVAIAWKQPFIAGVAMIGALLHILNHAVCKGLIFLAAGVVYHAMGTRKLETMGGLARSMPFTAVCFSVAAVAISGLPPFNSFISEFVIFTAGLHTATIKEPTAVLLSFMIMSGLALIGGLAVATYARTFGLVFLGAPRQAKRREISDVMPALRLPFLLLLAAIAVLTLASPGIIDVLQSVVLVFMARQTEFTAASMQIESLQSPVGIVVMFSLALIVIVFVAWQIRHRFFSAGDRSDRPTWDCGYAAPDARMQYTSSSFSQTIVDIFSAVVRPYKHGEKVSGLFPQNASFRTDAPDSLLRYLFTPIFSLVDRVLLPLRAFQHGRLHLYICYVAITLLVLLIWKVVVI